MAVSRSQPRKRGRAGRTRCPCAAAGIRIAHELARLGEIGDQLSQELERLLRRMAACVIGRNRVPVDALLASAIPVLPLCCCAQLAVVNPCVRPVAVNAVGAGLRTTRARGWAAKWCRLHLPLTPRCTNQPGRRVQSRLDMPIEHARAPRHTAAAGRAANDRPETTRFPPPRPVNGRWHATCDETDAVIPTGSGCGRKQSTRWIFFLDNQTRAFHVTM
jgi:hypothetical protein